MKTIWGHAQSILPLTALPQQEAERLLRMREDDNPVLVKYLF